MNKDMLDIKVFNGDDDIKYIKYDDLILCLDRVKETHKELQQRIDKAIEYIEKRKNLNWYAEGVFVYELLNILQGVDKE